MYKHILVPIDGTELSTHTATQAVELAREIGARITFLYATPDYSATMDGALLRSTSPETFTEKAIEGTHAILAKSAGIAKMKGVDASIVSMVSDRPHEAIIRAAEEKNCDLIFMASHGERGLRRFVRGSQTEKVLRNSPIPVLVSSVESNDPHAAMHRALAIIQDEHRSLEVVMGGLVDYCDDVMQNRTRLDASLVRRMLDYVRDFPGAKHHPKEEKYLFARLRKHTRDFDALLSTLESQHMREHELVSDVEKALGRHEAGDASATQAMHNALCQLVSHIREHIGQEERTILPAARAYLTDDDWTEIDAAFVMNQDPGFGDVDAADFTRLFAKIARLLPAAEKRA